MRKTKTAPLKGLIKTKKDLFNFAKNAFGLRFARHAVCEHHQAPLDAVWDIYSQQVRNAIIIGSRMSGKTSLVLSFRFSSLCPMIIARVFPLPLG
jgi:hypothetical protein